MADTKTLERAMDLLIRAKNVARAADNMPMARLFADAAGLIHRDLVEARKAATKAA